MEATEISLIIFQWPFQFHSVPSVAPTLKVVPFPTSGHASSAYRWPPGATSVAGLGVDMRQNGGFLKGGQHPGSTKMDGLEWKIIHL